MPPVDAPAAPASLGERVLALGVPASPDDVLEVFTDWVVAGGLALYPAQEEAALEVYAGANVVVATPTGSGKSMVALAAHALALGTGRRSFYTAPIKALVSEKFFALCRQLGSDNVGMMTGDAAVNPGAPIVCATAEIVANLALRQGAGRDGADAAVDQVVMDEFHYYADPDRGWAWQVPLLTLPRTQFVLMSATLGDTRHLEADLTARTGRPTVAVTSASRPVPLDFEYRRTALHDSLDALLATDRAPVYVVHFTQQAAAERAQSLMSVNLCTREEKDAISEAIGAFRFGPGFGRYLGRYVRHGIGVHHAGMLPKYRLLVEKLAQEGHLKVICGTDTLGVGINVPIRTVLFTQLYKYDGTRIRHLSAREFHQIAGRAGRAGFDTSGSVWAQAPEHVIENDKALAKVGDDARAKRKVVRKKPPDKGFVAWTDETFARLVAAPPEPLTSSFAVTHSMLLNVLARPTGGVAALKRLLHDNHEPRARQRQHIRRAVSIARSLLATGVLGRTAGPDGPEAVVNLDLQTDFRLNQALSPFVLHAVERLDPDDAEYPLDVLSMVEATLDDPGVVLRAQLDKLKGEVVADLKAKGVEYEERMAILDELKAPAPLRDETYELFDVYRVVHPWAADHTVHPKSVARDLFERALTFSQYVDRYGIARSEGLLLRYLTDAYKGLVQSVPEDAKTEAVYELTDWLGELVRQVDSSLIDEWDRLREGVDPVEAEVRVPDLPTGVTANRRAFRVMVRNAAFRHVQLLARRRWAELAELGPWRPERWSEVAAGYFEAHESVGTGPEARSPDLFQVREEPAARRWHVRQVLADPAGDHDWAVDLVVDLDASDDSGEAEVTVEAVGMIGVHLP